MVLLKGRRVMTCMGPGTILGFEVFDAKGWPMDLVEVYPFCPSRIVVQLDDPSKWSLTPLTPNPYFNRSEISELKE